jgi:hypothetical protein
MQYTEYARTHLEDIAESCRQATRQLTDHSTQVLHLSGIIRMRGDDSDVGAAQIDDPQEHGKALEYVATERTDDGNIDRTGSVAADTQGAPERMTALLHIFRRSCEQADACWRARSGIGVCGSRG